jgi:hypothetical protein
MEKIEVNSPKNQRIKGKLVERDVLCSVNQEVEFILAPATSRYATEPPYTWDDVSNLYQASKETLH